MINPELLPNTIYEADNLDVLRNIKPDSIDLIYLDPPFAKNSTFKLNKKQRKNIEHVKEWFKNNNEYTDINFDETFKDIGFKDIWKEIDVYPEYYSEILEHNSAIIDAITTMSNISSRRKEDMYYLVYMAVRIIYLRKILKPSGVIYLHCDRTIAHYLKVLMDGIFNHNLVNEIIWCYYNVGKWNNRQYPNKHDTILVYTKNKKQYQQNGIFKNQIRRTFCSFHKGYHRLIQNENSCDWWLIPSFAGYTKEPLGCADKFYYPTQKPKELLRKIILSSTNERDIVLDPFCGCATTCVVAGEENRRFIGIDQAPQAFYLNKYRLENEEGEQNLLTQNLEVKHEKYTIKEPMVIEKSKKMSYQQHKQLLFGNQKGKCIACNRNMYFDDCEVDHIIPQSYYKNNKNLSVDNNISNLQILCGRDNAYKGNKSMESLFKKLRDENIITDKCYKSKMKNWNEKYKNNKEYQNFLKTF